MKKDKGMILTKMTEEQREKPWWNRPIIGDKTLIDCMFISTDSRQKIPERTIYLHNYALQKLDQANLTLQALFSPKFSEPDFLVFARIKSYLHKYFREKNHYFLESIKFFTLVFNHLDNLSTLSLIESEYQNQNFLVFYSIIERITYQNLEKLVLQEKIKKIKQEYLLLVKSQIESTALENYTKNLLTITENPELLLIYFSLKRYALDNWEIFRKIKDFINSSQGNDLEELKAFILVAKADFHWLKSLLTNIVQVEDTNIDRIHLAKILQYLALNYKYELVYQQFKKFLYYLTKWEKNYYYVLSLREEYPTKNYHCPPSFKTKPSGFDFYKVYHDYLDSSYLLKRLT